MDTNTEIQRISDELRRQRPELSFRDVRGLERQYVRLRERVLIPANRTVSAEAMIQTGAWPSVTLLPLAIYHHNLIVTWIGNDAPSGSQDGPAIDWRYFSTVG